MIATATAVLRVELVPPAVLLPTVLPGVSGWTAVVLRVVLRGGSDRKGTNVDDAVVVVDGLVLVGGVVVIRVVIVVSVAVVDVVEMVEVDDVVFV